MPEIIRTLPWTEQGHRVDADGTRLFRWYAVLTDGRRLDIWAPTGVQALGRAVRTHGPVVERIESAPPRPPEEA